MTKRIDKQAKSTMFGVDGRLASEIQPAELAPPEQIPDALFGLRHVAAQSACICERALSRAVVFPFLGHALAEPGAGSKKITAASTLSRALPPILGEGTRWASIVTPLRPPRPSVPDPATAFAPRSPPAC